MLFVYPPNIPTDNASTQIQYEIELNNEITSTRLFDDNLENAEIIDLSLYFKNKYISSIIETNEDYIINSSTWAELIDENYDVISKLTFKKSIKIKSKIISISNFTPKIIID